MGTMFLAAAQTQQKGSLFPLLMIVAVFGFGYFFLLRPGRRRQQQAAQRQSQLMPGQRIRTTAGMYGTIISGDDRDVVVEIAPGIHVTMLRRAIMDVIPDSSETEAPDEDDLAPAGAYEAAPTEDVPVEDVRAEDARVEDEPGDSGSKDHPTDKK